MSDIVRLFVLICTLIIVSTQLTSTYDFTKMEGIQIYLLKDNVSYLYATVTGDQKKITVEANLLISTPSADVDNTNGIYAGVGFGSSSMNGSDIVLFTYKKGEFKCSDWTAVGYNIQMDVQAGGKNDVTYVSGNKKSLDSGYTPYATQYTWTCTKDITTLDSTDYSKFMSWDSNTPVIGAWGTMDSTGKAVEHTVETKGIIYLKDGSGVPQIVLTNSANKFGVVYITFLFILAILM
jgi:hypothetical protein